MDNHSERRYLISIDGGGTKTGVCVFDRADNSVKCTVGGGGNYKTHGIEAVRDRIQNCLRELLPDTPDISSETEFLVMGLSGCDSPHDIEVYTDLIRSLGFSSERTLICNDSEMIFRSQFDAPGISIVAGTGTIALAFQTNGSVFRSGGWGAPISDEGSGYWIGAEIVRKYLNWIDGTGEYNTFFSRFPEKLQCDSDEEAAAVLAAMNPSEIAEWAMPVFDSAAENSLCLRIIEEASEKTANLAASVFRKAGFPAGEDLIVAESGSLFKNDLYESSFRKSLYRKLPEGKYRFHQSDGIPAEDGIRLAMKMADKAVTTQSGD